MSYLHVLSPAGCQEQIPLTWREWSDWPTSPRRYSEIQFPPPNMAPSASWATGCAPKTWTTSSTWGSPTVWKVGWKWELHWILNLYPEGTLSSQVTIDNCVKDELRMRVFRVTLSSCIERGLFLWATALTRWGENDIEKHKQHDKRWVENGRCWRISSDV